ncbi:MAG: hypothetical protein PVI09_08035 [Anaerolineae bacterium]|jgi:hypothetical protein
MCCIFTSLLLFGPRLAILVWWLINPLRFANAFGSFIWPILGTIFLPWTTLMFLIVWSPVGGIYGLDWLWLGLGVLFDIMTYGGGGYGNRDRLRGY